MGLDSDAASSYLLLYQWPTEPPQIINKISHPTCSLTGLKHGFIFVFTMEVLTHEKFQTANGPNLNAHGKVFTYHKKQIRHVITNYYETVVMVEMASHA